MEVDATIGVDLIGMVKTNTKGFCKAAVEGLTNYFLGGLYILLRSKTLVPGERPLLSIGYKYKSWKVLTFVTVVRAGRTKLGIPFSIEVSQPIMQCLNSPWCSSHSHVLVF